MNKLIEYEGILYKVIPAHTGYAVSQCGKVLSRHGFVIPYINSNGVPIVQFHGDGGYNYLPSIVFGVWMSMNLFRQKIVHVDGDKTNCDLTNLRLLSTDGDLIHPPEPVTVQNATTKGYTILRAPNTSTRLNKRTKLTQEQVEEIVALLATSELSQASIAKRYGVCRKTINRINNKRTWKWLI